MITGSIDTCRLRRYRRHHLADYVPDGEMQLRGVDPVNETVRRERDGCDGSMRSVADDLAVYDDMGSLARLARLGGLMLLLGLGGIVTLLVAWEFYWVAWALAVSLVLLGGGLLGQLRPRFARRNTPFLVITPTGFCCPGLVDPFVPWSAVERILVNDAEAVCTTFFFRPKIALPIIDGSRANVRVSRSRRALAIAGPKPRGMGVEVFGARLEAAALQASETAEPEL